MSHPILLLFLLAGVSFHFGIKISMNPLQHRKFSFDGLKPAYCYIIWNTVRVAKHLAKMYNYYSQKKKKSFAKAQNILTLSTFSNFINL